MSDQQHTDDVAQLAKMNSELTNSLDRCRELVDECRAKLAANSNEPDSDTDTFADVSDFG